MLISWILIYKWLTSICYASIKVISGSQQIRVSNKEKAIPVRKLKSSSQIRRDSKYILYMRNNLQLYFIEKGHLKLSHARLASR